MRVGLLLPLTSPDAEPVAFARRAEELGFDGLFAYDHLLPPGGPRDGSSLEAYATLAAVAAATSRITIGTLVTRASLRTAGLVAKQAATLDDVSDGRFVLGIGTGDEVSILEHDAFGVPALDAGVRRDHLVETVRAVRALFRGEPFAGGEHVGPIEGPILPRPVRAHGPPVWLGGASERMARLAGREADGWNGWGLELETFAARVETLRDAAGDRPVEATWGGAVVVGRDEVEAERAESERRGRGLVPASFAGDSAATIAWLQRLGAAGAGWTILLAAGGRDRVDLIAERVLPGLARG